MVSCRILGSCTGLMQAIQALVLASKDLQREIVESGRVSVVLDWHVGLDSQLLFLCCFLRWPNSISLTIEMH